MNIKGHEVKIDKAVLGKAVGIMCMSWLALPVVYYLLLKKKREVENGKEEQRRENDQSEGESSVYEGRQRESKEEKVG